MDAELGRNEHSELSHAGASWVVPPLSVREGRGWEGGNPIPIAKGLGRGGVGMSLWGFLYEQGIREEPEN